MAGKMENKTVSKSISELFLETELADVHFEFKLDGKKVPAHKTILAAASPVFKAMFFGSMKENEVVQIVDANSTAFEEFLQFFYLPEVTITMRNIEAVFRLADKYDMIECLNICVTIFGNNLSKDNVISIYQLAIALSSQTLKPLCETQIKRFTGDIIKTEAFFHCDTSVLEFILKSESLRCKESELFNACLEWARSSCETEGLDGNNPKNLRSQLGDLFQLIRFETMTIEEITMIVTNEQKRQIFSQEETTDLFCIKLNNDFTSKVFQYTKRPARCLNWDSENLLICTPNSVQLEITRSTETTWFSVNTPLLLSMITVARIYFRNNCAVSSEVSIVEYSQQALLVFNVSNVLYQTTVHFTIQNLEPEIEQVIGVRPGKLYEIRFETDIGQSGLTHYSGIIEKHCYKMAEGVTIMFHRNPNDGRNRSQGLVSALTFNRI